MKIKIIGAICAGFFIVIILAGLYSPGSPPGKSSDNSSLNSPSFQGVLTGGGEALPPGDDYIAIASGSGFNLALHANGSIVCWGNNASGECNVPHENDFIAIAGGSGHGLALRSNGTITCWGGQCGDEPAGNDYAAISTSNRGNLALRTNGAIVAWGDNSSGQEMVPTGNDFIAVAAGQFQNYALRSNGTMACWKKTLENCDPPPGNNYVAISASRWTNQIALTSAGTLDFWDSALGWNNYVPPGSDYVAISAGKENNLALRSDGSIVCWAETFGSMCNITSVTNAIAISANGERSLAITNPRAKEILAAEWQKTKGHITLQSPNTNSHIQTARNPVYPTEYAINAAMPVVPERVMVYTVAYLENITSPGGLPSGLLTITGHNYQLAPSDVIQDPYHFVPYRKFAIKPPSVAIEEFKTRRLSVDETYLWNNGPVDNADMIVVTNISFVYRVRPTAAGGFCLQPVYRIDGYVQKGTGKTSFDRDYVPATENLVEFDFLQSGKTPVEKVTINDTPESAQVNSSPHNLPPEVKEDIEKVSRDYHFSLNKWEFNPTKKDEIILYAFDIRNESSIEKLQGMRIKNYTLQIIHDSEFETTMHEVSDYLWNLRKNPDYQINDVWMSAYRLNDPPVNNAEVWVYKSTPENKKLDKTTIQGWKISVYVVSSPPHTTMIPQTNFSSGPSGYTG